MRTFSRVVVVDQKAIAPPSPIATLSIIDVFPSVSVELTEFIPEPEADKLFETTYKVSKATIMRFPGHGQHNNNHAWLLSRCSKNLDEALEYGNRAVQLEPENGAFLDTLAEVHFQRGNRIKAIEISEKAVNLLDGDAQVKRQLERFKNGDPSDR